MPSNASDALAHTHTDRTDRKKNRMAIVAGAFDHDIRAIILAPEEDNERKKNENA